MDKEVMESVGKQFPEKEAGDDGDTVSCSIHASPSGLHCGPECRQPHGETVELLPDSPDQGLKKPERPKGSQVTGSNKQKTNNKAKPQTLRRPPIKAPKAAKPKVPSALSFSELEMKNQVSDLQQKLKEAISEKKQLEGLLHRHTVALQHCQKSEYRVSQIKKNHNNETRALKELLRDTRACRDRLARQLQTAEKKLLSTQSNLQHLQLLSQKHNLLWREELTWRLAKATAELEEKDMTIADMKKNLGLCQASFNRQILFEQRKSMESRRMVYDLLEDKYHLTKTIQDKVKDLEKLNIYSKRFPKASNQKGRGNKMAQSAADLLETQYQMTEEDEQSSSGSSEKVSANILQHQSDLLPVDAPKMSSREENAATYSDAREGSFSEEGSKNQSDSGCVQPEEPLEDQERSGEKEDNENIAERADVPEESPDVTQLGTALIPCGESQERHGSGDPQQ